MNCTGNDKCIPLKKNHLKPKYVLFSSPYGGVMFTYPPILPHCLTYLPKPSALAYQHADMIKAAKTAKTFVLYSCSTLM